MLFPERARRDGGLHMPKHLSGMQPMSTSTFCLSCLVHLDGTLVYTKHALPQALTRASVRLTPTHPLPPQKSWRARCARRMHQRKHSTLPLLLLTPC